jgi:hypothetical protein
MSGRARKRGLHAPILLSGPLARNSLHGGEGKSERAGQGEAHEPAHEESSK